MKVKPTEAVANKVFNRIKGRGRGSIHISKDFLDLGSRAAVDQALARLTRNGSIRRLGRGLYDYPKIHPKLGPLTPDPDAIAKALAKKTNSQLQVSGANAVNALGLSTQVPARIVYLTSGDSKRVHIGNQIIDLRHAVPRNMKAANKISGMVIQALRHIGKNSIDAKIIDKLRHMLPDDVKVALNKDIKDVPDWMRPIITDVIGEI